MTIKEFIDFSNTVVLDERKPVNNNRSARLSASPYLFHLAGVFGVDSDTREEIITGCLEKRFERIRGSRPNLDTTSEDKAVIEMGLSYLAGEKTKPSTKKMFEYLEEIFDRREYHKTGWRDEPENPQPVPLLSSVTHAIGGFYQDMPGITPERISCLQEIKESLEKNADEPSAVENLQRILSHFENSESSEAVEGGGE